ncbi:MAG: hypothetical protein LBL57_04490, partial [Tannerella sp.]|nr:hypothetical protein [Tannerella sp.]
KNGKIMMAIVVPIPILISFVVDVVVSDITLLPFHHKNFTTDGYGPPFGYYFTFSLIVPV